MWFKQNRLTMNANKTKNIPFGSYKSGLPHMGNLVIDGDYSNGSNEISGNNI